MRYVFCSFGEEGRKMLLLISHENKRLQRILLNDNEIEIWCLIRFSSIKTYEFYDNFSL